MPRVFTKANLIHVAVARGLNTMHGHYLELFTVDLLDASFYYGLLLISDRVTELLIEEELLLKLRLCLISN